MYQLILFLPLIGFLFAAVFGRGMDPRVSEYVTSALVGLAAILSWVAFILVGFGDDPATKAQIATWMQVGALSVDWSIRVDTLTVVMLVVVNTVSTLVHVYSIGYMHDDDSRPRFFAYLSLFTFAMLTLVTADNLVQMFFGWEGVGLASYLLIGFWYQKPSANAAAMKAFVVNRVGDFGYALGIFGVFVLFGSVEFDTIFANAADFAPVPVDAAAADGAVAAAPVVLDFLGYQLDRGTALTVVCLLLFMGAMGKSAQVPLHTWLPDAMEGPTPVSALIHAATMVTAGVFMVARLSPIFELSIDALTVVTIIGAITAIFAATVGLVQNDIKRVIAYSTCSQLGYMFVAMGIGAYGAGMFHLFTHAFFKALLFLGAGSVIHAVGGEQDMRRMGGLRKHIPATYWLMVIGTLALTGVGIPGTLIGTAGFFSKDAIIESAFVAHGNPAAGLAFVVLVIAALLTSFYSWRLIFMTFHGRERAGPEVMHHVHESPPVMLVPLYVLAAGALLAGVVFHDWFFGHHYAEFWRASIFTLPENVIVDEFHEVPKWVKFSPLIVMLIGLALAYWFYVRNPKAPVQTAEDHPALYRFLVHKWYFDELYDRIFVRPAMWLGRVLWKRGDERGIDRFGPDGLASRVMDVARGAQRIQSGFLYHYAFAMLIGIAMVVTYLMLGGA